MAITELSNNVNTNKIVIISHDTLKNNNLKLFTDVIYKNFIHLSNNTELKHTKQEIYKVLKSNNAQVYLIMKNKSIVSYLVGEITKLNDGRNVLYITYLFTSDKFRNYGLASKLLKLSDEICSKNNLDGIMLVCDTENDYIYNFYLMKNFMPDMILRRYSKYDVLFKSTRNNYL